jgi:hypothetical protein
MILVLAATLFANDYSKPEAWLCRPGSTTDACAKADLTATVVSAQGTLRIEKWKGNAKAPIDCFYVYPTVSNDATPNSDMTAGPEEINVILHQFARFGSQCRLFAPLYRQVTLTALRANMSGKPMAVDRALAYNDVLDAWNHYLKNDNQGRGFLLIGHSQGSGVLTQLIRNEIDGKAIQKQLISAMLLGTNLPVPRDKDVGGAFQRIPLCRSATQTGCVVAYVSFRANEPPPKGALFGRVADASMMAACVNPAGLLWNSRGVPAPLHAYLASGKAGSVVAPQARPWVTPAPPKPIVTNFVSVPGLLSGECVSDANGSYLAVKVNADPKDPRTDEIAGDVVAAGAKLPAWGLHLIDANVAMGDLVALAAKQSKAYRNTDNLRP